MALMSDEVKTQVAERLKPIEQPVRMLLFLGSDEYSPFMRQLADEVATLNPNLQVEEAPEGAGAAYGIEHLPGMVMLGPGGDTGMRWLGLPSGHEFAAFLADLIDASNNTTALSAAAKEKIRAINQDVVIKVFSTPG